MLRAKDQLLHHVRGRCHLARILFFRYEHAMIAEQAALRILAIRLDGSVGGQCFGVSESVAASAFFKWPGVRRYVPEGDDALATRRLGHRLQE